MELILVIAAIIYSIWSEVNKKKEEDNVDINFSELSSLDEFFKPDQKKNAANKSRTKKEKVPTTPKPVNYDELPGPTRQTNYTRVDEGRRAEKVNYDKLAGPTRQVNYTRVDEGNLPVKVNYDRLESVTRRTNYERDGVDGLPSAAGLPSARSNEEQQGFVDAAANVSSPISPEELRFNREELLKAFVMSEVMQRYNLHRIYSRIPGIKTEE